MACLLYPQFNNAVNSSNYMQLNNKNINEMERICKEVVMIYSGVLSWLMHGVTMGTNVGQHNPSPGPSKYKAVIQLEFSIWLLSMTETKALTEM
jgi:hypothetical protein